MTIDEERLKRLLEELIKFPKEVEWVEFKESNWDPIKTGELISGLANSANLHNKPFGYHIFGINDLTHDIIGTKFKPKSAKKGELESIRSFLILNFSSCRPQNLKLWKHP